MSPAQSTAGAAYRGSEGGIEPQDTQAPLSGSFQRDDALARRPSQYSVPDYWVNLDEVAVPRPVENVREASIYRHRSLERTRSREIQRRSSLRRDSRTTPQEGGILEGEARQAAEEGKPQVSKFATQLFTLSYLIFFAILGTLARVGLKALTSYPGAPAIFTVLWANFGGSLVMGYLVEDRNLFRLERESDDDGQLEKQAKPKKADEENGSGSDQATYLADAKKAQMAVKKTIPLYIGLATGFCGSFTSFSSFIADAFLAISNNLVTPGGPDPPSHRNGGYSFMALLAVILITVSVSLSGLFIGAHLAIAMERFTVSIRYPLTRRVLDPLVVVLGWGSWLGAVLLAIFPPHDIWRGQIVFSLVFAPLGCLMRFYLSLYLNGKVASFPVGTFVANVFGTAMLGMCWDIAHVPVGGVIGCQVLQGIEDGFCGCLTTISTWVAELSSLRRKHAYIYGTASVVSALVLMIAIMGGLRWSEGFSGPMCST